MLLPAMLLVVSSSAVGQSADATEDERAPDGGVEIFGERLMHYSVYPDDGGSARFDPPIPFDDRDMLLTAMKSATRALFGEHRLAVTDEARLTPKIGAVTKLQDLDYDYLFMLDGSVERGVSTVLIQRKEVDRSLDEGSLLKPF